MPRGAAVIPYRGKRGTVWRIKYVDADGKQVMETLGPEREGWTHKKAEAELRERLVRVEKKGYRKPQRITFGQYVDRWFDEGKVRRAWKPQTIWNYRVALGRLKDTFGPRPLGAIRPRDISAYIAEQLETLSAKTLQLDLTLLHMIFNAAIGEEIVDRNPAVGVERPKVRKRKWRILCPEEVGRVARAFADDQARLMFQVLMLTGLRRFELLGLRWRDVDLVTNTVRIVKSKSEEGERSIALSPALAEALWQHRRKTAFQGDDEFVFCHPERGSKVDHEWYAERFRKALTAAGITDYVRPFHDARHASLTIGVLAGEQPLELMARAGHRSMATTRHYLHLAGVTFPERAAALEAQFGGRTFYPSELTSDDLSESDVAQEAAVASELRAS